MVASDGDSAEVVRSTLGIPQLDDHRVEAHATDVSTDANGDGTATVSWDTSFSDGTVFAVATLQDRSGDVAVSSAGADQCTVAVDGHSTTDGTVTVTVLVVGPDAAQA